MIRGQESDNTRPGKQWSGVERRATIRGQESDDYGATKSNDTGPGKRQNTRPGKQWYGVKRRATIRCQEKRPYGATKSDNTEPEKQQYEARRGDAKS